MNGMEWNETEWMEHTHYRERVSVRTQTQLDIF